jgi:CheY-like chemotaxis protein
MANQTKSAFLAQMSHELRTPLNGILGYTQLFHQDNNLTDRQQQGIHVIHRCGEHLLTLINDILDFSKMEAGKLELNPTVVSLTEFCMDIVDLFKLRAEQKGLTFVYQPLTTLPTKVYADAKRLRQILLNLLSNAVKFTQQGQVTLTVAYHQSLARFTIEDTGAGIAANQLQAIFLPFHQVGDKNRHAEGTGLGLSISKNLVELMNGQLQAHSQLGKGSLFWFEIPLPEIDPPTTTSLPSTNYTATGFKHISIQKNFRILVVDDIPESRLLLVQFLCGLGFQVLEAENGQTALQLALDYLPNLIITDVTMPVMDGLELARQIRQTKTLTNVIIIAMSANVLDSYRHNSLEAGCNDFMAKPIDLDWLLNLLPKYLPLEWQNDVGETFPNTTSLPLAVPSQEQIATLLQLVVLGDIDRLIEQTTQLEYQDAKLSSFVTQVKQLTTNFEIDKLEIFLRRTMGNGLRLMENGEWRMENGE